jgi:hypothetical protein
MTTKEYEVKIESVGQIYHTAIMDVVEYQKFLLSLYRDNYVILYPTDHETIYIFVQNIIAVTVRETCLTN